MRLFFHRFMSALHAGRGYRQRPGDARALGAPGFRRRGDALGRPGHHDPDLVGPASSSPSAESSATPDISLRPSRLIGQALTMQFQDSPRRNLVTTTLEPDARHASFLETFRLADSRSV